MNAERYVAVTTEWALWGRQAPDNRYGVLACSSGTLSRGSFDQVVARYNPGTLGDLPQVTIGWLPGKQRTGDQVAFAIHDRQPISHGGAGPTALIRLYCLPFASLAAGSVGYQAVYEALGKIVPPLAGRELVEVRLVSTTPAGKADVTDRVARRAAGILLTGQPVCVLGADRASLDERLRFIDAVASLLPYGLRSRLSCATWVSSTLHRHRFRLFFSNAERRPSSPDRLVIWGNADDQPIGHDLADRYLSLLSEGSLRPEWLARCTEHADFSADGIGRMLERLESRATGGKTSARTEPAEASAQSAADAVIEMLLRSCGQALSGDASTLRSNVNQMRRHLTASATAAQRMCYARLIERFGLLTADSPIDRALLADFYDVLVRLAVEVPLSYEAYCMIENCASGPSGRPMHPALRQALTQVGLTATAELLVFAAAGGEPLARHVGQLSTDRMLSIAADPQLLPRHTKIVCEIITGPLSSQMSLLDRRHLKTALGEVGYLAPVLRDRFPDDGQVQADLLGGLLRAAYGRRLSRIDLRQVLSSAASPPAVALFIAVMRMIGARDVPFAAGQFAAGHVAQAGVSDQVRLEVQALLSRYCGLAAGNARPQVARRAL